MTALGVAVTLCGIEVSGRAFAEDPMPAEDELAAARVLAPAVPLEEAIRRLHDEGARLKFVESVASAYPDQYAGWRYDGGSDSLALRLAGETPADLPTRLASSGLNVTIVHAKFSYRVLAKAASELGEKLRAVPGSGAKADPENDAVAVGVPPGQSGRVNAVVDAWEATVPRSLPILRVPLGETTDETCTSRHNCGSSVVNGVLVTLRTGVILSSPQGVESCSLGFTATASDGSRWAVHAGHCVDPAQGGTGLNATWAHGTQNIGPAREYNYKTWASFIDVARIRMDSTYWKAGTGGWLYNTVAPDSPAPVTAAATDFSTQFHEGQVVCLNAWSSTATQSCGTIVDTIGASMMPEVDFDACPGDSGGGWYTVTGPGQRMAMGIHSGQPTGSTCHQAGNHSIFSALPDINAYWDANAAATIRVDTR